jgi:hypothetical protein
MVGGLVGSSGALVFRCLIGSVVGAQVSGGGLAGGREQPIILGM